MSNEPSLEPLIKPSIVKQVGSRKIGIIGYLTPETADLAQTGAVKFFDEVEKIQEQVDSLKKQGVEILIAVGHSGYDIDLKIAAEVRNQLNSFFKCWNEGSFTNDVTVCTRGRELKGRQTSAIKSVTIGAGCFKLNY